MEEDYSENIEPSQASSRSRTNRDLFTDAHELIDLDALVANIPLSDLKTVKIFWKPSGGIIGLAIWKTKPIGQK